MGPPGLIVGSVSEADLDDDEPLEVKLLVPDDLELSEPED